jgi:hypothetical protein
MLSPIVQHSVQLVSFISCLGLLLSHPQRTHLLRVLDGLLVSEKRKTISDLYRQQASRPDPKTGADFFRESGWDAVDLSQRRKRYMLKQVLQIGQQLGVLKVIKVSLDDSLGKKGKATRHLDVVDHQHNHGESHGKRQVYSNGYVYIGLHVQLDPIGFTFDIRLYLRAATVRRLNRERQKHHPERSLVPYRSKMSLAQEMLTELATLFPDGYQVYVLFDSWYASAKLMNFCRRQGWHVICALKSNRRVNKQRVDKQDQLLKHKHYQHITLSATPTTPTAPTYYVRTVYGYLEAVRSSVCVIISRRHKGDKHPKFFACTDLSLTAQAALRLYQQRWSLEVDNLYLKVFLGLGDFRLQSFEATTKWFAVVLLDLNFLQLQQAQAYAQTQSAPSLADLIYQHRQAHFQTLIRAVAEEAIATGDVEQVIQRFILPLDSLN